MDAGVLFVCYSSRGHQLVFRYPPSNQPLEALDQAFQHHATTMLHVDEMDYAGYYTSPSVAPESRQPSATPLHPINSHPGTHSASRLGMTTPVPTVPSLPTSTASTPASLAHSTPLYPLPTPTTSSSTSTPKLPKDTFLGFEPHILSDILSPKPALCDRKFQLTVDNMTFLGHPTLLNADRPGAGHVFARNIQKRRLDEGVFSEKMAGTSNLEEQQDKNHVKIPIKMKSGNPLDKVKSSFKSSPCSSRPSSHTSTPIASRSHLASAFNPSLPEDIQEPGHITPISHPLTMFNLVFAFKSDSLSSHAIDMIYKQVVSKVTSALKYEQLKRHYIRKQVELIMGIKEHVYADVTQGKLSFADMRYRILASSSLARMMAHLYHAIRSCSMTHLVVNGSIDLSLHIMTSDSRDPVYPSSLVLPDTSTGAPSVLPSSTSTSSSTMEQDYPLLRPYKTLLLLNDPEEIVKGLPWDPSPLLVQLVQVVTPTMCFDELSSVLDCSLSQIYRLAAHLVCWKQAKIIDVVSTRHVYVVSPMADMKRLHTLSEPFSNQFPQTHLPFLLSELKVAKPYSVVVPAKENKSVYLEMLTFLLKHDMVIQLNMYIYIIVPEHIRRKVRLSRLEALAQSTSDKPMLDTTLDIQTLYAQLNPQLKSQYDHFFANDEPYLIPDPMNPTDIESEYLALIAGLQPPPLPAFFLRIAPHLHGKSHMAEIAYRESIPKKDLRLVLNRYREQLLTVLG